MRTGRKQPANTRNNMISVLIASLCSSEAKMRKTGCSPALRRENIPFQEIAKIQNCSVNTSLARMRYAIKQLTNKLKDWESDNS